MRSLRDDPSGLPTAIEEMVRWTAPSPSKRRTATCDVTLGGCHLLAGQKVQIWEGSANRDAAVFVAAEELLGRFSLARVVKPVEWTHSNRHTGIRHLVVELG
jgi:hypothetical protein